MTLSSAWAPHVKNHVYFKAFGQNRRLYSLPPSELDLVKEFFSLNSWPWSNFADLQINEAAMVQSLDPRLLNIWSGFLAEALKGVQKIKRDPIRSKGQANLGGSGSMLYSAANDPQTANDPRIGPQMIPNRKWSPMWTANDPAGKRGMAWSLFLGSRF